MRAREERRDEAWYLGIWTLGAVAALLILYVLVEGAPASGTGGLGPLVGASIGAGVAYLFTRRQRREEEQRRRRALATILLSEVQLLYAILKDIDQAYFLKALHTQAIEVFHTAMYDQAGADRLLFQSETAHVLTQFYQLIHTLRTELNHFRDLPLEQRTEFEHSLWARTRYTAEIIEEVMHKLSAESGIWPKAFPSRTYPRFPEDPEFPPFPSFPKPL